MIRSNTAEGAHNKKARRPKASKPTKPEWIGYLPSTTQFHQNVHRSFVQAGFKVVRLGINKDWSMASFWLKLAEHPPLKDQLQAHAAIYRLLRAGGVNLKRIDLAIWLDDDSIDGAFTPPQHKVPGRCPLS